MKTTITMFAFLLLATVALAQTSDGAWFGDGEPEVILGAYFDIAGTDTLMTLSADTLSVYLVMWNAGQRNEGDVVALEYMIQLPEGLRLIKDELPLYSHLCLGTVETGFSQTLEKRYGDGLLLNTLRLYRDGEVADDARIRVLPHPDTEKLQWVAMPGGPKSVRIYLMGGQDAILNPNLTTALESWKPVKSR
jgi:hypothetical protein